VSGLRLALVLLALAAPAGAAESEEDAALRARIEARLAALEGDAGADVRVAVRDGQVLLQGRVHLLEHSLRAAQAAWTTEGVRDVDNELRVVPVEPGSDAFIERRIRLLLKGDGRFTDTSLELSVTAGFVALRGMFQDPADVLALKHRIASIPGVLDVRIDAVLVARRHPAPVPPGLHAA
jgi:osmotically-inducible protein OsmY